MTGQIILCAYAPIVLNPQAFNLSSVASDQTAMLPYFELTLFAAMSSVGMINSTSCAKKAYPSGVQIHQRSPTFSVCHAREPAEHLMSLRPPYRSKLWE